MAPLSVARQPFGSLDGGRLQNIQNMKNRQNGLKAEGASSTKRRHSHAAFADEDSENVDPSMFGSSKRAKNTIGLYGASASKVNLTTPTKSAKFILTDAPPSPDDLRNPIKPSSTVKRATRVPVSRLHKAQTPSSCPIPKREPARKVTPAAGRSPKSKSIGILTGRRTASPFTRIDPPASLRDASPLSLDAALSATVSGTSAGSRVAAMLGNADPLPAVDESSMPRNWFFDIHEDTLEDTLTNIMEFSTSALDISDDEGRRREMHDRGKENIPPAQVSTEAVPTSTETVSMSPPASSAGDVPTKTRRVRQTKRATNPFAPYRAPLADLPPSDFHDDSSSFLLVTAPSAEKCKGFQAPQLPAPRTNPFTSAAQNSPKAEAESHPCPEWPLAVSSTLKKFGGKADDSADIEIWESGSADGDADTPTVEGSGSEKRKADVLIM
ncbi:MAG: hypothetical protein M1838_005388 [Thelocarpon superellum]|nr:MAG: hypothetical protein M1838_005388 [Thelocarpon superellum]